MGEIISLRPRFYVEPRFHVEINLPSFSPKQVENFDETFLKSSTVLPFCTYFRKQFLKTKFLETFSPSRLNRNNSLGYFRRILMPGIFQTLLDRGILPGAS